MGRGGRKGGGGGKGRDGCGKGGEMQERREGGYRKETGMPEGTGVEGGREERREGGGGWRGDGGYHDLNYSMRHGAVTISL